MASAYMKSKMRNYLEGSEVIKELKLMLEDDSYHTTTGYSIDTEAYPDHAVPFVEHHMNYLQKHSKVDPEHYLSNLRLMLKVR